MFRIPLCSEPVDLNTSADMIICISNEGGLPHFLDSTGQGKEHKPWRRETVVSKPGHATDLLCDSGQGASPLWTLISFSVKQGHHSCPAHLSRPL